VQLVAGNAGGSSCPVALNLSISPITGSPVVTSSRTQIGTVGTPMSFTVVVAPAAPAPTFLAMGLPSGLALNPATGVVSGTPTESGTFNVIVTPSNTSGAGAPVTIIITVRPNVTFGG
jgi:hypothetical protein